MTINYDELADNVTQKLLNYGFSVKVISCAVPATAPQWAKNCNAWSVTVVYKDRAMVTTYYTGSGITRIPSAADVISCISGDYATMGNYDNIDEFAQDFEGDSISETIRTYRAMVKQSRAYARLMGGANAIEEVDRIVQDY